MTDTDEKIRRRLVAADAGDTAQAAQAETVDQKNKKGIALPPMGGVYAFHVSEGFEAYC